MRYKKRRFYRKSTNFVKMKFQSFMDISTSNTSMQVITISAGGPEIINRLGAQFGAYKYYRIGNISVKLVPASTLPVDPSGLSYSVNDPGVDPRDQLTPGMMRITNGEDVLEDISGLSDDQQIGLYNNMLLDPRWYKWMLQSGVKRYASPRYWQIGQLHQDKWPGATMNFPMYDMNTAGTAIDGVRTDHVQYGGNSDSGAYGVRSDQGSSPLGLFQVGHRGTLGWLPTDGLAQGNSPLTIHDKTPLLASPPEIEVMKIILPKAYKTKYYYRMFITETVYFKEPIVNFGVGFTTQAGTNVSYRPLDVFHYPGVVSPILPTSPINADIQSDPDLTGGNYGND